MLRSPVNVALSPILVLTRFAAYLFRRLGWRGTADWLSRRRMLLPTSVARRVEVLIVTELLELPLGAGAAARDPSALGARRPSGTAVSRDDPHAGKRRRG
ncbi:MAG: hypothetical protein P3W94_008735 [Paracoccus sp. (in: a-proteobacteria)]|nr:hypothetical protein [Paracoccus sp. (in: a-proteobacteria)]